MRSRNGQPLMRLEGFQMSSSFQLGRFYILFTDRLPLSETTLLPLLLNAEIIAAMESFVQSTRDRKTAFRHSGPSFLPPLSPPPSERNKQVPSILAPSSSLLPLRFLFLLLLSTSQQVSTRNILLISYLVAELRSVNCTSSRNKGIEVASRHELSDGVLRQKGKEKRPERTKMIRSGGEKGTGERGTKTRLISSRSQPARRQGCPACRASRPCFRRDLACRRCSGRLRAQDPVEERRQGRGRGGSAWVAKGREEEPKREDRGR